MERRCGPGCAETEKSFGLRPKPERIKARIWIGEMVLSTGTVKGRKNRNSKEKELRGRRG